MFFIFYFYGIRFTLFIFFLTSYHTAAYIFPVWQVLYHIFREHSWYNFYAHQSSSILCLPIFNPQIILRTFMNKLGKLTIDNFPSWKAPLSSGISQPPCLMMTPWLHHITNPNESIIVAMNSRGNHLKNHRAST